GRDSEAGGGGRRGGSGSGSAGGDGAGGRQVGGSGEADTVRGHEGAGSGAGAVGDFVPAGAVGVLPTAAHELPRGRGRGSATGSCRRRRGVVERGQRRVAGPFVIGPAAAGGVRRDEAELADEEHESTVTKICSLILP
ncbi:unnamed protein product, partial [Ectocarpus sp. 12 AP-2014]